MHKNENILFLIIIQIFLVFPLCFTKQINLRKIISLSEITLTINGTGAQKILSDSICKKELEDINYIFEQLPDEILVNGVRQEIGKIVYNLSQEINNVTMIWYSSVTNCNCMFSDLSNIINIDFSKFDTSQVAYMQFMFSNCYSLTSLDLSNFDTRQVRDMYRMFFRCKNLKILQQNFKAPLAFDITSMFDYCLQLESIDLSNFEPTSVLFMALMFYNCINLKTVNLSNFAAEKSLFIDNLFNGCSFLRTIDLSDFKTSNVIGMGNMFLGCKRLQYLDLSSFDFSSVTNMGNMFSGCKSLTSIIFKNFDTSNVRFMDNMFNNCIKLTSLDLSGFSTKSVIEMSKMFYGCTSLEYLELGNFDTNSVTNMAYMFYNCSSLRSLNLSSFNPKLVTDMSYMFSGCNTLTTLEFGNFETNSVTNMAYMFHNCNTLNSLDLSSFSTESVTDMSYMFYGCNSLKSLELGIFETNSVTNMEKMFYNCISLNSLNLKYFNTLKVGNFNNIFDNCKNILLYCINDEIISPEFKSQLLNFNKTDCHILCSFNLYKYNSEKNICIKSCLNDVDYQYEYKDICYQTCPNGTINYINDKFCNSLCSNYYDYEQESCIDEIREGYYLNNTDLKTIDKCDLKCYNCTSESMSHGLCVLCNTNQRFYPKMNDSSNVGKFINCYNETPVGYILDSEESIYKTISYDTNKIIYTDINSEETNKLIYTDTNSDTTNKLINTDANSDKTNKLIYTDTNLELTNNINVQETLESSETINNLNDNDNFNSDKNKDERNYPYESELKFYYYDSNSKLSNYSYEINSNINELKKIYPNLTFIELSQESKNIIIESNNLDEKNYKLYLVINDYPSNDSQMAINNYDYKLILENGTELDLSKINEDFFADMSIPIINKIISNFDYYELFYEQGYDIYSKNNEFYNDTCSPANLYDNDITLEDRQKEIYPNNVTLCKSNCEYKSVDIEIKKINCYCNLNINKNYTLNYEDNNFIIEDDGDFFDYLLDKINYKIFKCYKLVFNIQNLITNISFYIMISSLFIIIIINIKFYFCDLSKIKILSVKNSIIDNINFTRVPKEKNKIKIKSKKNLLAPIKKMNNKFIKKSDKKNVNKVDVNVKCIKNIYNFSQINISGTNVLLKNYKNTKNFPKKKSIRFKLKEKLINNKYQEDKEDFNELPFTLAKKKDKRDIFDIFVSVIIKKLILINLFFGKEKIKILLFNENMISFLVDFFFNALLYSDEIVSHKYHNNGKLDFIVSLVLSLLSNIISSIVCYFLIYSEIIEERFDQILQMKRAYKYPIALNNFLRSLKLKVLLYLIKEIFIILFCFYYLIIFTIVYSYSKISLLYNYLYSLIEKIIESLIVSIFIAFTRKISLQISNRYIYNTSKYINDKF